MQKDLLARKLELKHKEIVTFINNTESLYSEYWFNQLIKPATVDLIGEISVNTEKSVAEIVTLFYHLFKYISVDPEIITILEETDGFDDFVRLNRVAIIELAIKMKNQANLPQRALPILEVLYQLIPEEQSVAVIELGASLGLIGCCLLNALQIIYNAESLFSKNQQIPSQCRQVDYYLGIDLNIPDVRWVLSFALSKDARDRLQTFIENFQPESSRFQLLEGSAIGFSNQIPVQNLSDKASNLIVLTSFMLYQLNPTLKAQLEEEIYNFIGTNECCHWINQTVDTQNHRYFVEVNGKKTLELSGSLCEQWSWIY